MSLVSRLDALKSSTITACFVIPALVGAWIGYRMAPDGNTVVGALAGGQIGCSVGGLVFLFTYLLAVYCEGRSAVGLRAWIVGAGALAGAAAGMAAGSIHPEETLCAIPAGVLGFVLGLPLGSALGYDLGRFHQWYDDRWGRMRGPDHCSRVAEIIVRLAGLLLGTTLGVACAVAGWTFGPRYVVPASWQLAPMLGGLLGGGLTAVLCGGLTWVFVAAKPETPSGHPG